MRLLLLAGFLLAVCCSMLPQSANAGYHYVGCYIDKPQRDLPHLVFAGSLNINICYRKCKDKGYSYFGLQYYSYCFCGNRYGLYGSSSKSKCNLHCSKNKHQTCGGAYRNSVYSTGIVHTYPYKYLGCYQDTGRRDLPLLGVTGAMSSKRCYETCKRKGFAYFGLQYSSYCYCGNKYGRFSKKPERECNMPCHGNKGEHCGAAWRNSVYATGLRAPPKPFIYRGCYVDAGARDLKHSAFNGKMTPDLCYRKCKKLGYKHFGVQYYTHCFCGNTFGRYGKRPISECNTICRGDKSRYCGGAWRNSVYTIGGIDRVRVRKPTYLGCYIDHGNRDLPYHALTHKMSVAKCNRECTARKFAYFGLQYRTQCFCGNSYGMYGSAPKSQCRLRCDGKKSDKCGGVWRNSVWRTNFKQRYPYKYLGCYQDAGKRDLKFNVANKEMSVGKCYRLCKKNGKKYFGVQYRYQCFCGNSYGKYSKRPRRECNMACDGNRGQHCGGVWRNSVYAVNPNDDSGKGSGAGSGSGSGSGSGIGSVIGGGIIERKECIDPYDNSHHKKGSRWVSKATVDGMCYHYRCSGKASDVDPHRIDCMDSVGNCVRATTSGVKFACRGHAAKGVQCSCLLQDGFTFVQKVSFGK